MTTSRHVQSLEPRQMLAAGQLDSSFGVAGQILGSAALGQAVESHRLTDTVPLADGSVILAGTLTLAGQSRPRAFLAKQDSDGNWDRRFGDRGLALVQFSQSSAVDALASVDSAGRILVGVEHQSSASAKRISLARFSANGTPDRQFASNGVCTSTSQRSQTLADISVNPNNQPILAANMLSGGRAVSGAVYRFKSNGTLDQSFGRNGVAGVDAVNGAEEFTALALDGNRILLGGTGVVSGGDRDLIIARFKSDGGLDRSFDGNGIASFGHSTRDDQLYALSVDGGSRPLVVTANSRRVTSEYGSTRQVSFTLHRRTFSGRSDLSFGSSGFSTIRELSFGVTEVLTEALAAAVAQNGMGYRVALAATTYESFTGETLDFSSAGQFDPASRRERYLNSPFYYAPTVRIVTAALEGGKLLVSADANNELGSVSLIGKFDPRESDDGDGYFHRTSEFFPEQTVAEYGVAPDGNLLLNSDVFLGNIVQKLFPTGRNLPFAGGNDLHVYAGDFTRFRSLTVFPDGSFHLSGSGPDVDGDYFSLYPQRFTATGENDSNHGVGYFDENSYAFMSRQPRGDALYSFRWHGDENDRRAVSTAAGELLELDSYVIAEAVSAFNPENDYNNLFFIDAVSWRGSGLVTTGRIGLHASNGQETLQDITIRQNPDGTLDRSFGTNGVLYKKFDGLLASQRDGGLLYFTPEGFLARRLPNGQPDRQFGTNGVIGIAGDFTVDSRDRIILNRQLPNGDTQVFRFTAAGKTDRTFGGGDGILVVNSRVKQNVQLMVLPDDKLLVTAYRATDARVDWSAIRILA